MNFNWPALLAVATGGAFGSAARWGTGLLLRDLGWPPATTLVVNIVGCFVLGLLTSSAILAQGSSAMRAGVTVGFLGAFTTFSTYAVEVVQSSATPQRALLVFALHNGLGLLAAAAGLWLGAMLRPAAGGASPA
jgi:CrcB protein